MKLDIKYRLAALGVAVGLMGALIVFITLNSQRQATNLQIRLNDLDVETLGVANQFSASLRNVNNSLISYGINRDPTTWQRCVKDSRDLNNWINDQKTKLRNPAERNLLEQIGTNYVAYLAAIEDLHAKIQFLGPHDNVSISAYAPSRAKLQAMMDLSRTLANLTYESQNELLAQAHRTLSQLRFSVLLSLALLFIFGVALSVEVYRDLIAPLRVKLVESQALAERSEKLASLGLLAAGVAHEIRTPLTAIKAALYIQKKKFQADSAEYENVDVVEREILRLERIVNNFIKFARPAEPEAAVLDVDDLLLELQFFFTPQLADANIQLIMEILAPMQIRADAAQIKQVLINLVQNAADSIGREGKITLRARPDQKRLGSREVPVVALEVSDTGKGISPEVEKRLFDPFFTTKENGSGLGLSIAAQIVQKHGGELQYQTLMNHGTTFGIILPRLT